MEQTDIELVAFAQAGDDKAFAALVRRHQARLRAFLRRLCAEQNALADDIAQETLIKAHKGLSSFRGGGSFRSWLYAIAYREFLQEARRKKRTIKMERELVESAAMSNDDAHTPDAGAALDLRRAMNSLSDQERAALLMCDAAGMSHAEAASALQTPLGSVKTYLARARQKMRAALGAECNSAAEDTENTITEGASNVRP